MANVRRTSVNTKPVRSPAVDPGKPCPKPEAAKGDDDLMSTESIVPVVHRQLATDGVAVSMAVEGPPDESPAPPLARQDLSAVLERVSKNFPHLTYLPAD